MAAYTFNTALYPSVRAAIGLDINEVSLPDSTLDLPIYKQEAERFIMRNLTAAQYENLSYTDEADYAAVLYLASLVMPTLRIVLSERIAGGNLTYSAVNLDKIAADLRARALARISDVQTAIPVVVPAGAGIQTPHFFGLAHRVQPHAPIFWPGAPAPDAVTGAEVHGEPASGATNGSNLTFFTLHPFQTGTLDVYRNGQRVSRDDIAIVGDQEFQFYIAPDVDDYIATDYNRAA